MSQGRHRDILCLLSKGRTLFIILMFDFQRRDNIVAYFSEYIFIYQKVCISEIIRYMVLSKSLFSNKRYFMKFLFFYTSGLKEDRDCQFGGLFQDNFFILDIVCLWSAEGYMLQKVYSGVPSPRFTVIFASQLFIL